MSESFRQIYQQFVDLNIPEFVRQSYRLIPDIKAEGVDIRKANFDDWISMGFDRLVNDHLGAIAYEDENYVVISMAKNATDTDYDIMFICLPRERDKIQHLPCYLPQNTIRAFYECLNRGVEAINRVAERRGDNLRRVYVHHHVGPFELNDYSFNISFPQLHMHVMGVTDRDIDASEPGIKRLELVKTENLRTYTDPTVLIAKDIYEHEFQTNVNLDYSTSSLILNTRTLDHKISDEEKEFLPILYYEWHKWWAMLALCFSELGLDEYNRLELTLPSPNRREYLQTFIEKFPFFSTQSLTILDFLAENSKPFNPEQLKSSTYAGTAGAIGWVHNHDSNISELRFGPRLLTSSKKMGASDGFYVGFKDKSKFYPLLEERLNVQREIFTVLAENLKTNPVCP